MCKFPLTYLQNEHGMSLYSQCCNLRPQCLWAAGGPTCGRLLRSVPLALLTYFFLLLPLFSHLSVILISSKRLSPFLPSQLPLSLCFFLFLFSFLIFCFLLLALFTFSLPFLYEFLRHSFFPFFPLLACLIPFVLIALFFLYFFLLVPLSLL